MNDTNLSTEEFIKIIDKTSFSTNLVDLDDAKKSMVKLNIFNQEESELFFDNLKKFYPSKMAFDKFVNLIIIESDYKPIFSEVSSGDEEERLLKIKTEEEEDDMNAKLDIDEIVAIEPDPEINTKNLFKSPKLEWRINYPDLPEIDNLELTNEFLDIANVCDTSCFFKNTALIEYYDNDRESRIAKGSIYTEADYQEVITDAAEVIEEALCKGDVNLIEDSTRKNIRDLYLYDYTLLKFWFDKYKPLIKFSAINWSSYGEDTVTIVFSFSDAIAKYQDYAITFKQVINKRELWR